MIDTVFCVNCGGTNTEESETGNDGWLFAAEDMYGSVEVYSELEIWNCIDCEEKFFK